VVSTSEGWCHLSICSDWQFLNLTKDLKFLRMEHKHLGVSVNCGSKNLV